MKVVFKNDKPFDPNKKIYTCSICGDAFQWDNNSSLYGSVKDMEEHPEKIKYYCSDKCRNTKINSK